MNRDFLRAAVMAPAEQARERRTTAEQSPRWPACVHASRVSLEELVMADQPADGGSVPQDRYKNPEAALGGADAVEKTT